MATAPLFVADFDTLKSRLRLSGVPSGSDGEELIREGIMRARLEFYSRLGVSRVNELLAVTYDDEPVDTDEILRALCNTVEIKLCWIFLLDTMPTLFMDGSGKSQEIWNEEAPFRQGQTPESTKARLREQVDADLDILSGDVELGDATNWQITNNESEDDPPVPGETAFGDGDGVLSMPVDSGD